MKKQGNLIVLSYYLISLVSHLRGCYLFLFSCISMIIAQALSLVL